LWSRDLYNERHEANQCNLGARKSALNETARAVIQRVFVQQNQFWQSSFCAKWRYCAKPSHTQIGFKDFQPEVSGSIMTFSAHKEAA
jgi:hypothetical protein